MKNEKRLIDASILIRDLTAMKSVYDAIELDGIIKALKEAPTVDAGEVVHGRWKYYHKQNIAVCTNCSFERDLDANFGRAVSCPNCAAKMDGGKTND